jgi:hypothetical protein
MIAIRRLLIALALCLATAAHADDLADFNAAVEAAMRHHRVALGYLRTGNIDLAVRELEAMGTAWDTVIGRFGSNRPAAFRDNALFGTVLTDVATRIVTIHIVIDIGRLDAAQASLTAIRHALAAMRRESGVEVLADCVLAANIAFEELLAASDGSDADAAAVRRRVLVKTAAYADALARCDAMAPPPVKSDPEFRRLIDGALASLTQMPQAAEARDADLTHRLLIELRAFDNLLAFRFG